ncbi:MAG: hypothetical protein J6Q68_00005, partial [Clostridia bacterium]|nr:hypothetical protein [Clostridia bacterium]
SIKKVKKELNKNKLVLTIVCIFVAIVLLMGIILGTAFGIKSVRSVVSYKGVALNSGEANYLASYYKYEYVCLLQDNKIPVYDDAEFWAEQSGDGEKTYGELLSEFVEYSITEFVVFNYIFDSSSSLSSEDKECINDATRAILDHKAGLDKDVFDSAAQKFGYDFSDFKSIVKKMYKYEIVRNSVLNANADSIQTLSSSWEDFVEEYYENYSHVKLLFVRTEETFMLDDEGNRVRDENNVDMFVPLSDNQKAERQKMIAEIRAAISAFEQNTTDVQMSPAMFNSYLSESVDGDPSMNSDGYYFYEESKYTNEFAKEFGDIVEKSMEMKENSYAEVAFDGGVCFIYKYKRTDEAYTAAGEGGCFSDFILLAARALVASIVDDAMSEIKIKDSFYEIDFINLAQNYEFVPIFAAS